MQPHRNPYRILSLDAVDDEDVDLLRKFANLWLGDPVETGKAVIQGCTVSNQPIRENREFRVEIGHGTFAAAKDAWETLKGRDGKHVATVGCVRPTAVTHRCRTTTSPNGVPQN